MIIALGILAHNEASDIGNLFYDLRSQDLLSNDSLSIEIHVVANGCSDSTVSVSNEALSAGPFQRRNVRVFVHDVPQAGKSNAWNELIHKFASPKTDFVFLLDADIRIPEKMCLQVMLDSLIRAKRALIAVDESVKDLSLERHKSIIERLIVAGSGTSHDTRIAIAGGLYCARFEALKRIWMPIGLPGEDGFLRAMILTSNFTEEENIDYLVFVKGARHIFESERRIRDVFHHNIRLTIGTAINVLLFKHFYKLLLGGNVRIADYIRQRNAADKNWINKLIADKMKHKKYFIIDPSFVLKRLKWFSLFPISEKIRKAPIFLLGVIFDIALFIRANHLMRRGAGAGYW
jgi:glycosyltransferase involved in cell wall biosynthesis